MDRKDHVRQVGLALRAEMGKRIAEWPEGGDQFEMRVAEIEKWARSSYPDPREAPLQREALDLIKTVRASITQGDAAQAARFALNLGILFQKSFFKAGKKPGARSATTIAIEKLLHEHQGEKPAMLWTRLVALPGWQELPGGAEHRKSGSYISRNSFRAVVSKIRKRNV